DLELAARSVLDANPDVLTEIMGGRDLKGKKRKFICGLVMKETRGRATPGAVEDVIARFLEGME
ncbi:MAG: Asp-tRNA(Asn)/Glu-tRNA(Gln) amidotransferase GatCAB subunit B, partial [Synergistota bacterium]|nr:Asp-tRNA(Asn)/Glu-tRNA(Gln) amidotransferase GatCAB subunit B [Synergistota bacterium]